MSKVLITGIAGFIGFHTARALTASGIEVIGVDNLNEYYQPALKRARLAELSDSIKFTELDIADADAFAAYMKKERPQVVLHLAAQAGVRYSIDHPFAYAHSNLLGHLSVLEACRNADNLSHLIYASSSSVYGGNLSVPFFEDDPVNNPVSLYAATKRSGELMSSTYAHLYGLKQVGMRFFTVYGPWGRPDMAYWMFTDAITKGEPIRIFNHGDMSRDFTYIDDVVHAIEAIVETPPAFSPEERPHRIYNIGNHTPVPLLEMVSNLEQALGLKAEKILEPMQPGDVKATYADVSRLQADYGFNPTTSIADGLTRFVEWRRANPNF